MKCECVFHTCKSCTFNWNIACFVKRSYIFPTLKLPWGKPCLITKTVLFIDQHFTIISLFGNFYVQNLFYVTCVFRLHTFWTTAISKTIWYYSAFPLSCPSWSLTFIQAAQFPALPSWVMFHLCCGCPFLTAFFFKIKVKPN